MSSARKQRGPWRRPAHVGTSYARNLEERKRIILSNQGGIVGFVLTMFYVALYHATGLELVGWIALGFGILYGAALPLNRWGYTRTTPVLLVVNAHLHVATLSYLLGRDAGIHFFLFPIALTPFLFFSPSSMRYIRVIFLFSISLMTGLTLLYDSHPPYYKLAPDVLDVIENASLITGLMTTIALMYYLYTASERVEGRLHDEREKSERLLLNILPREVADELKEHAPPAPVSYDSVTIAFTDFQDFSKAAGELSPVDLLRELNDCFTRFDAAMEANGLEKLRTVGDSYMYAGGIPSSTRTHAVDAVLAAIEIQAFMFETRSVRMNAGRTFWQARLGIHTGPLVAGIVGRKKFTYDVWGDTVNQARRMESSCEPGKINVSRETFEATRDFFDAVSRGMVITNKGESFEMFFVTGIKRELSENGDGRRPNDEFRKLYARLSASG